MALYPAGPPAVTVAALDGLAAPGNIPWLPLEWDDAVRGPSSRVTASRRAAPWQQSIHALRRSPLVIRFTLPLGRDLA